MLPGARALPGPPVPGIGRRMMSMLYESFLASAIAFLAAGVFYWISGAHPSEAERHGFQVYLFAVLGLYFVACWSHGGRTLPMQTWKMRMMRENGQPVGPARALLRYLLAWPSLLLCVGLVWALVDRDRQFLHDRLAGTRIVLCDEAATRLAR
ncbi:MAG: RDD family protein [Burkholderiales bacterium]